MNTYRVICGDYAIGVFAMDRGNPLCNDYIYRLEVSFWHKGDHDEATFDYGEALKLCAFLRERKSEDGWGSKFAKIQVQVNFVWIDVHVIELIDMLGDL